MRSLVQVAVTKYLKMGCQCSKKIIIIFLTLHNSTFHLMCTVNQGILDLAMIRVTILALRRGDRHYRTIVCQRAEHRGRTSTVVSAVREGFLEEVMP